MQGRSDTQNKAPLRPYPVSRQLVSEKAKALAHLLHLAAVVFENEVLGFPLPLEDCVSENDEFYRLDFIACGCRHQVFKQKESDDNAKT